MAAKVSIASSTAARAASTHASESSASREPSGASASNRFSSVMDAASQPPEGSSEHKPSAPAHSSSDAAAATAHSNHFASTGRAPAKSQGPSQDQGQGQSHGQRQIAKSPGAAGADAAGAGTAGATSSNSSAAMIDGNTQDQDSEGLDLDKVQAERLAAAGTAAGSPPADASDLTLLLSSPGGTVDGSNSSDAKSTNDDDSKGADEDASLRNAAAAGALAVNMIMGSAGALMPNLIAGDATQPGNTGAIGSASTATDGAASPGGNQSLLIRFDALAGDTTPADGLLPSDLSTLKSPSGDSQSSELTALAGSDGSAAIGRNLTAATTQPTGIERTINLPVGDRNWSGAVAGHVQWMVSNNIQSATLQLSPDHLGPVEVRIDVHQSQVNVSFTADHPETRSALEQSVPALREIFAGGGLTLGQATVQQDSRSASQFSQPSPRPSLLPLGSVDSVAFSPIRALGLVDEYA